MWPAKVVLKKAKRIVCCKRRNVPEWQEEIMQLQEQQDRAMSEVQEMQRQRQQKRAVQLSHRA